MNFHENSIRTDCQSFYSTTGKEQPSFTDSSDIQRFEESVTLALMGAEALTKAFQAQIPDPRVALQSIVDELQVVVKELQATYEEVWVRQEALWDRQERILKENERYSNFFQFIAEGAMFTDGEGLIAVANPALGKLLNIPESVLVGHSISPHFATRSGMGHGGSSSL